MVVWCWHITYHIDGACTLLCGREIKQTKQITYLFHILISLSYCCVIHCSIEDMNGVAYLAASSWLLLCLITVLQAQTITAIIKVVRWWYEPYIIFSSVLLLPQAQPVKNVPLWHVLLYAEHVILMIIIKRCNQTKVFISWKQLADCREVTFMTNAPMSKKKTFTNRNTDYD